MAPMLGDELGYLKEEHKKLILRHTDLSMEAGRLRAELQRRNAMIDQLNADMRAMNAPRNSG